MRLRAATTADAEVAADIYLRSRAGAGDDIPPGVHPPGDVRRYVADVLLPTHECWLAETDGVAVGLLALDGADLHWLWVVPEAQGHGVGSALLEHAKLRRPDGLALWVFQTNTPAIGFYERRGFRRVRATDGDNEEGAPDFRYVWGAHPEG